MKSFLASLLLVAAAAIPAAAGPDFGSPTPHGRSLAASHADEQILPSDDIVFDHASSALDDLSQERLKTAARWMKKHPKVRLVIEGHTNSVGSAGYNQSLALARANIVRAHLVALGVKKDRLITVVYGESEAEPTPSSIDRRVVLIASREPTDTILAKSMRRGNLMAARWEERGTPVAER
jgi:outer membrane protein OmpA-like peptidoglycan-associated protein